MTNEIVTQAIAASKLTTHDFFTKCAGEIRNSTLSVQAIKRDADAFDADTATNRETKVPYYVRRHFERESEKCAAAA